MAYNAWKSKMAAKMAATLVQKPKINIPSFLYYFGTYALCLDISFAFHEPHPNAYSWREGHLI